MLNLWFLTFLVYELLKTVSTDIHAKRHYVPLILNPRTGPKEVHFTKQKWRVARSPKVQNKFV